MLLDYKYITLDNMDGVVALVEYEDSRARYLTIGGERVYDTGIRCDTCSLSFERLDGGLQYLDIAKDVGAKLREGVADLDDDLLVGSVGKLFPRGEYCVTLSEIVPKLVTPSTSDDYFFNEQVKVWGIDPFWGLPNYTKTKYYRLQTKQITEECLFLEFAVPCLSEFDLEEDQLNSYKGKLESLVKPTALAFGIVENKQPANFDKNLVCSNHLSLTHYLIDGHHKIYAAAELGRPLTLISFIDMGECDKEEMEKILKIQNEQVTNVKPVGD